MSCSVFIPLLHKLVPPTLATDQSFHSRSHAKITSISLKIKSKHKLKTKTIQFNRKTMNAMKRERNWTSLSESSTEFSVRRKLNVEIAFDLTRFLTKFLPTWFLQIQIRIIPHSVVVCEISEFVQNKESVDRRVQVFTPIQKFVGQATLIVNSFWKEEKNYFKGYKSFTHLLSEWKEMWIIIFNV